VTEIVEKGKNENLTVRLLIVVFVFPILVLAFHALLFVPAFFVGLLLVHFGGHPKFVGNALSVVTLLPACWGAIAVCKRIWTSSK